MITGGDGDRWAAERWPGPVQANVWMLPAPAALCDRVCMWRETANVWMLSAPAALCDRVCMWRETAILLCWVARCRAPGSVSRVRAGRNWASAVGSRWREPGSVCSALAN